MLPKEFRLSMQPPQHRDGASVTLFGKQRHLRCCEERDRETRS
jgi:hypothetical protein